MISVRRPAGRARAALRLRREPALLASRVVSAAHERRQRSPALPRVAVASLSGFAVRARGQKEDYPSV